MPKPGKKAGDRSTPVIEIRYPDVVVELFQKKHGNPMTVEKMKELLGWEEVTDKTESLLTDRHGKFVRLKNNTHNRPFYPSLADGYAQEQLRNRWRLNGETMIFDQYGGVISCQHRGVGLILGEQDRTGPNKEFWKKFQSGPLTIDAVVVHGIESSDDVVNTVDRGKSRSDADVIYRGPWFADKPVGERRALAKIAGVAVRQLWFRTGLSKDAFAGKELNRSVTETTDFLIRHPGIVRAVKHIYTENGKDRISVYLSPGYAAGMLYLMSTSTSDPKKYHSDSGLPKESDLDFSMRDKAEEFWAFFGNNTVEDLKSLSYAESPFSYTDEGGHKAVRQIHTMSEESTGQWRLATICKAWNEYALGNKVTVEKLVLPFIEDVHGMPKLILGVWATVGGIDVGDPKEEGVENTDEAPTPQEVEEEVKKASKGKKSKEVEPPKEGNELFQHLWKKYPNTVLIFRMGASGWKVFGKDLVTVTKVGGNLRNRGKADKTDWGSMWAVDIDAAIELLHVKGHKVARVFGPDDVKIAVPKK